MNHQHRRGRWYSDNDTLTNLDLANRGMRWNLCSEPCRNILGVIFFPWKISSNILDDMWINLAESLRPWWSCVHRCHPAPRGPSPKDHDPVLQVPRKSGPRCLERSMDLPPLVVYRNPSMILWWFIRVNHGGRNGYVHVLNGRMMWWLNIYDEVRYQRSVSKTAESGPGMDWTWDWANRCFSHGIEQ